MDYKKLFENFLNEEYKGLEFKIEEIAENAINVFAYLSSENKFDIPTLVLDKNTNKIKDEIVPPFTDDSNAKTIWKNDVFDKDEEEDYDV